MENSENTTPAKPFYDGLLSVIVPCKNEVEAIPVFYGEFKKVMQGMGSPKYELIFVEDGSTDGTLDLLRRMSKEDPSVRFISFSRNFGKEAAMYAGLKSARGDYVTIMDVDLQDPPSLLPDMFSAIISEGYDSVASRRCTRCGEPPMRTHAARLFYKILNSLSDLKFKEGARDYRLMTRRVLDAILGLEEYNRFIKGMYEWVGFKTKWIDYENVPRSAGETKWSNFGLLVYSLNALTSFSTVPIKMIMNLGLLVVLIGIGLFIYSIVQKINGNVVSGWTSLITSIWVLGGIQLICLSMIGEYVGKIFTEVKRRPRFTIQEDDYTKKFLK